MNLRALALSSFFAAGCGTSEQPGGPVAGPLDRHCVTDGGMLRQATSQADCRTRPDGGVEAPPSYGETRFGTEGDDDDCKYRVAFSVPPIYQDTDVEFTVTVSDLADGTPARGAGVYAEATLGDTHPAPPTNQSAVEGPDGTYKVGPVRFDASGRWTVRFHFYGDCFDYADDSPHGHAAFYIDLP